MSNSYSQFVVCSLVGTFAVALLGPATIRSAETVPRPSPAVQIPPSGAPNTELVRPPNRPMLGVILANQTGRVIVTSLYVGGPAERAGLQIGDQIITINGQEVVSDAHLLALLDRQQPGHRVNLLVRRGVWTNHFVVTLGDSNAVSALPRSQDAPPMVHFGPFSYRQRPRGTIDGRRAQDIYDPYLRALNTNFGP